MSEHINGKLKTVDAGSTTEFDIDTETGWTVATAGRSYARRLAAAWNVCEGIDTESLETGATLVDICERSNGYQSELSAARADLETARKRDEEWHEHTTQKALELTDAIFERDAARALLREIAFVDCNDALEVMSLRERATSYLDACDTPGEPT